MTFRSWRWTRPFAKPSTEIELLWLSHIEIAHKRNCQAPLLRQSEGALNVHHRFWTPNSQIKGFPRWKSNRSRNSKKGKRMEIYKLLTCPNLFNRAIYSFRIHINLWLVSAESKCLQILLGNEKAPPASRRAETRRRRLIVSGRRSLDKVREQRSKDWRWKNFWRASQRRRTRQGQGGSASLTCMETQRICWDQRRSKSRPWLTSWIGCCWRVALYRICTSRLSQMKSPTLKSTKPIPRYSPTSTWPARRFHLDSCWCQERATIPMMLNLNTWGRCQMILWFTYHAITVDQTPSTSTRRSQPSKLRPWMQRARDPSPLEVKSNVQNTNIQIEFS